ncbi:MAG TPA: hypothetical protein VJ963_03045 [Bacteroidales bacterium]|nr:hypothetical protein [Bacteroidales bacterium]
MYRKKSDIIGQIQTYHKQVAGLYYKIYLKAEAGPVKSLLLDLYRMEKEREKYLERHKKVSLAMNCWLDFPCERLSDQVNDCLKYTDSDSSITMEDILKLELHFDDCLIRLYNILESENALNETTAGIFYYMLKKTKREQDLLSGIFYNLNSSTNHSFSVQGPVK